MGRYDGLESKVLALLRVGVEDARLRAALTEKLLAEPGQLAPLLGLERKEVCLTDDEIRTMVRQLADLAGRASVNDIVSELDLRGPPDWLPGPKKPPIWTLKVLGQDYPILGAGRPERAVGAEAVLSAGARGQPVALASVAATPRAAVVEAAKLPILAEQVAPLAAELTGAAGVLRNTRSGPR